MFAPARPSSPSEELSLPIESELSLPLESGKVVRIPKMTGDDFNLFIETLNLWKRRIVIKPQSAKESAEGA